MQTLRSNYRSLCTVTLPPFAGRQKYMHTFDLAKPEMAVGFEDYLEPVKRLCRAAGALAGTAHMTVDERAVQAGQLQRRPGPHVDGCFIPAQARWGHDGPGPHWAHYCNSVPGEIVGRMPVIMAASVAGCRVWRGEFLADPRNDGDPSHIQDQLDEGEVVPAGVGCLLSADCVHESAPFQTATQRTFLRIALPVGFDGGFE